MYYEIIFNRVKNGRQYRRRECFCVAGHLFLQRMAGYMDKAQMRKLLDTAAGRIPADVVIKNGNVVDVYQHRILACDVAIADGRIAGLGEYQGVEEIDAKGAYLAPGLIDSHIHIESSHLSPEEFGRIAVPHGTTTVIADPHEIANVCGMEGIAYMEKAAAFTALDVKVMLPSCVPATSFEHSGAELKAKDLEEVFYDSQALGLGEFMDYPGVIGAKEENLDKLLLARKLGKVIDGHSPGLLGRELNAYAAAGVSTDHECTTVEEMNQRISRGMYVLLREGSCCHDLRKLIKGGNAL